MLQHRCERVLDHHDIHVVTTTPYPLGHGLTPLQEGLSHIQGTHVHVQESKGLETKCDLHVIPALPQALLHCNTFL
jgi:hypothetical protein